MSSQNPDSDTEPDPIIPYNARQELFVDPTSGQNGLEGGDCVIDHHKMRGGLLGFYDKMTLPIHFVAQLKEIRVLLVGLVRGLADAVFVIVWVGIQQIVHQILSSTQLSWIDSPMLMAIQVLFALSTLLFMIRYVGLNIVRDFVQVCLAIREEIKKLWL